MATIERLVVTAAENLGIHGEGETLGAYETNDLTEAYNEAYNILQGLELTTWSPTDDIPDEYVSPMAMLTAGLRSVKYKIPDAQYVRILGEGWGPEMNGVAMKTIRKLQVREKMGQTKIENF